MIPRIKNILYATDLSENSAYVFRYAVNSAQKHEAKIHILHVIEKPHPAIEAHMTMYIESDRLDKLQKGRVEEQIERIHSRLKEVAQRELRDVPDGLKMIASIHVVEGDPAVEILEKIDTLNCDILIMGTHGKGWIAQTFLGSVAEKVLGRIRKPVFIIPVPKGETDISFKDI
jgi:nucleotide-binding universal stress UspA family protein